MDSRGRFWVTAYRDVPLIFDASGKLVTALGRTGQGPEEFRGSTGVITVPGDSVAVLDHVNSRLVVVAPDLRIVRSVALPSFSGLLGGAVALAWPDSLLVSGMGAAVGPRVGPPLHIVAISGRSGAVIRSYGADPEAAGYAPWALVRTFAETDNGDIWIADSFRFRLRRQDRTGAVKQTLERHPEWFGGNIENPGGTHDTPPASHIKGISVDVEGRLWVFMHTAGSSWRDAWTRVPRDAREVPAGLIDSNKLYKTVVEVIDPASARLLGHHEMEGRVISALPGGQAAFYRETEIGIPSIEVISFSLAETGGSSPPTEAHRLPKQGAHIR